MTEIPWQSFLQEVGVRAHDCLNEIQNIPAVPVDFLDNDTDIVYSKARIKEYLSKPEVLADQVQRVHQDALNLQYRRVAAEIAKEREEYKRKALVAMTERDEALASTEQDPKTGLGNIKAFENDMIQLLEDRKDFDDPKLALMVMDLDNFKEANTILGHSGADNLIKTIALALETMSLRQDSGDRVYRLYPGGDELVFIVDTSDVSNKRRKQHTGQEGAEGFAKRIRDKVKQIAQEWQVPNVGASIGVIYIKKGETIEEIVKRADEQMYKDKDLRKLHAIQKNAFDPEQSGTTIKDIQTELSKQAELVEYSGDQWSVVDTGRLLEKLVVFYASQSDALEEVKEVEQVLMTLSSTSPELNEKLKDLCKTIKDFDENKIKLYLSENDSDSRAVIGLRKQLRENPRTKILLTAAYAFLSHAAKRQHIKPSLLV
jgi:diguanylate cyclase (GGDEF)-like protein